MRPKSCSFFSLFCCIAALVLGVLASGVPALVQNIPRIATLPSWSLENDRTYAADSGSYSMGLVRGVQDVLGPL